jgi:hypothetical protein
MKVNVIMNPSSFAVQTQKLLKPDDEEVVHFSKMQVRKLGRDTVQRIFDENLFGSRDPAPKGTLRGIDVLEFGNVIQKMARAVRIVADTRGRLPDFCDPQTWFEKLVISKFFAPIPMPSPADKLGLADYRGGSQDTKIDVFPVIWSGQEVITKDLLDSLSLPDGRYYAKSNCGSGTNFAFSIPVRSEELADLEKNSAKWLTFKHGERAAEWWYQLIRPQNFIERDMSEPGTSLTDWKFHTGGGRVLAVQIDKDRHQGHCQLMYDRDFNYTDRALFFKKGVPDEKPAFYEEMVEIAEDIGREFEFARVDLYRVRGQTVLGEVTLAPIGAQRMPISKELDEMMGAAWQSDFFASRACGHQPVSNTSVLRPGPKLVTS